jgi:two-component system chemotaxis response regulator CheY
MPSFLSIFINFDILILMSEMNPADVKIIIVDDSDFSRSVINKMLSEEGFLVIGEAASAEAALAMIRDKKPDIVIVDIVMPNVSGLDLTEKLNQSSPEISVIMVSSLSQEHIILDAISAGASDFIAKPIQKQQLIDSVEKIMAERTKD